MLYTSENAVKLIGEMGEAPIVKKTANGEMITLSIRASMISCWIDDQGARQSREKTTWHRVVSFQSRVIGRAKQLARGTKVAIVGYLDSRTFIENGSERHIHEIIAEELQTLKPRPPISLPILQTEGSVARLSPCPRAAWLESDRLMNAPSHRTTPSGEKVAMTEDQRIWAVSALLSEYVKSPSLRHIRDPRFLSKLASEVVRKIDQGNSIWRKWDGQREVLLKSAIGCWIPLADLHDFLNHMPGPALTVTDVSQRLKALEEEPYISYPDERFQPSCVTIYEREKAEGTELPAIIGLLRDHVEHEEVRLREEQQSRYQQWREEDRIAREQRLLSGADCKWTQLQKSKCWFCRANGRTYRLSPAEDKLWTLCRVNSASDHEKGILIGRYQRRGDATKVVAEAAYRPEPR